MPRRMSSNHAVMLKRRGYDPKNYTFVKNTYTTVYFRDIRTGKILLITKGGNN